MITTQSGAVGSSRDYVTRYEWEKIVKKVKEVYTKLQWELVVMGTMKSLNLLSREIKKYGKAKCDMCNKGYYELLHKEIENNIFFLICPFIQFY